MNHIGPCFMYVHIPLKKGSHYEYILTCKCDTELNVDIGDETLRRKEGMINVRV